MRTGAHTMPMTMNTIADFYRPVLTSKWFYLSIFATVLSWIALRVSLVGFTHDFILFGPQIASIQTPLLRFFFLTYRYGIALTEIGILSWEWYAPIEKVESIAEPINLDPLAFDANKGLLSYHGKTCKIPEKSYQHTICAKLFECPGTHMDEKDILKAVDWDRDKADSDRLVKDAVYAISAKAKRAFGIEKALVWEKLTAWVNDEYLR